MLSNQIAVHYKNHKVLKGRTHNFSHNNQFFHLYGTGFESLIIEIKDLKAIFFIKDYQGNKDHIDDYSHKIPGAGIKMRVKFFDDEVVIGYSLSYTPKRHGFFFFFVDVDGNNERIFVVKSSTKNINLVS